MPRHSVTAISTPSPHQVQVRATKNDSSENGSLSPRPREAAFRRPHTSGISAQANSATCCEELAAPRLVDTWASGHHAASTPGLDPEAASPALSLRPSPRPVCLGPSVQGALRKAQPHPGARPTAGSGAPPQNLHFHELPEHFQFETQDSQCPEYS